MTRARTEFGFKAISYFSIGFCLLLLALLFGAIIYNGIQAISIDFLISPSKNFGSSGGIIYQIVGSLLMVTIAGLISFPIAVGASIYQSEYLQNPKMKRYFQLSIFGLNGIPSVIYGLFGLLFFVNILGTGISWVVGSIILSFMILPTIIHACTNALQSIPVEFRENGAALGLSKWKITSKILMPQALNGAVTGLLLGLARAIGETAPIMFIATAFSGVAFPTSLWEPASTLPTHILALAQEASNPKALENAWGTGLVLLFCVMLFSLSAMALRLKNQKQ